MTIGFEAGGLARSWASPLEVRWPFGFCLIWALDKKTKTVLGLSNFACFHIFHVDVEGEKLQVERITK